MSDVLISNAFEVCSLFQAVHTYSSSGGVSSHFKFKLCDCIVLGKFIAVFCSS